MQKMTCKIWRVDLEALPKRRYRWTVGVDLFENDGDVYEFFRFLQKEGYEGRLEVFREGKDLPDFIIPSIARAATRAIQENVRQGPREVAFAVSPWAQSRAFVGEPVG